MAISITPDAIRETDRSPRWQLPLVVSFMLALIAVAYLTRWWRCVTRS